MDHPHLRGGRGRVARVAGVLSMGVNAAYLAAAPGTSLLYVVNVLVHPFLGVGVALAFAVWWWRRRDDAATFAAGAVTWLGLGCGTVLALWSLWGPAPRPLLWAHVAVTLAGVAGLLWARRPGRLDRPGSTRGLWHPAAGLFVLAVPLCLLAALVERTPAPSAFVNPPAAADFGGEAMGGEDGPFHPSAAHTAAGSALPAAALPPADTCAGAGCHDAAVAQWEASPHRWAGRENPWYRATLAAFEADAGAAATGWCAGCHEPGRLVTGAATTLADDGAGAAAGSAAVAATGVSCAACHGIAAAKSTIGQGQYVLAPPGAARLAGADTPLARRLHRWAVRLDPAAHARAWSPAALTGPLAPETCATCHKAHFDAPLNGYRWVQHMNDYDQWQASHISGYGGRSFYQPSPRTCVDCHMPRDDGGARSHRFAAADAATALLSGDPEQLAAVEASLASGAVTVDLFALTADDVRLAPLDGAAVSSGTPVRLDVVVATPGMGHFFPGGKMDTADVWLELVVHGADGGPLVHSGGLDADGGLDPAAHRYRLRMIDGELRPLEHGDLQRARAVVYQQRIMPLGAEVVRYRFTLPDAAGDVDLTARLRYRELSRELQEWTRETLDAAAPVTPPESVPVLTVAEDRATVRVVAAEAAPAPTPAPLGGDAAALARRFNDYGIGLFLQGDNLGARAAFERVTELTPEDPDVWLNLAWTTLVGGDLAGTEEAVEQAEELAPERARTLFFRGRLEQSGGDAEAAIAAYRAAVSAYPRDRVARVFLLQVLMERERYGEALEQTAAILEVDPEYSLAHYNAMLAHRTLGDAEAAEHHRLRYERFRQDDSALALARPYLERHPHDNLERQAIHEHVPGGEVEQ